MLIVSSWWKKILWKKWKFLLIGVAIIFVFMQLSSMSSLGFIDDFSNKNDAKYRQHVAAKKVLSKWKGPLHSKFMRDSEGHNISLRGTRIKDLHKYFPNARGKFVCFSSNEELDFIKVNDDYCDCPLDGSDEPGTNACNNGTFYCENSSQKSIVKVPSYKVNDGICDCCDGSDEWLEIPIFYTNSGNHPIKYHPTQCGNYC